MSLPKKKYPKFEIQNSHRKKLRPISNLPRLDYPCKRFDVERNSNSAKRRAAMSNKPEETARDRE